MLNRIESNALYVPIAVLKVWLAVKLKTGYDDRNIVPSSPFCFSLTFILLQFFSLPVFTQDTPYCTPPAATIEAISSGCPDGIISLKLKEATGYAPFNLVINGVSYNDIEVGQIFTIASAQQSIWGVEGVPENANANDGQSIEAGVKFRSAENGYITGIRFYKGVQNTGVHVGSLWSFSGERLASATFENETAGGWQQVSFSAPVAINANTTYIASYLSPGGTYAYSGDFFTDRAVTNGSLTALQSQEGEPNGLYIYGSGFPDKSYNSSNYWVDVMFATSLSSQPTTKYTLTSITDSHNCTSTGEALSTALVPSNPLPAGQIISIGQSCDSDTAQLIFDAASGTGPFNLVINGSTYTNITSGSAFNAFIGTPPDISIWSSKELPVPASLSEDTSSVELGVKFKSTVSGKVSGIRFYKASENSGIHTGSLWSADGKLLANGIFTNESANGWQQMFFSTPAVIQANTVYIASYHTTGGRYMFNNDYFTDSSASSSFLTALSAGENGPNGVFKYGPGSIFPDESFKNTNYWADVVFKPDTVLMPANNLFRLTSISDANNCTVVGDPLDDLEVTTVPCPPSLLDSMVPVTCSPKNLKLFFSKPISCASIAADGSDFTVDGTYAVGIRSAKGDCLANGYTSSVLIELDKRLQEAGNFQVYLQQGGDGNTVLDDHNQQTPKESALAFDVKDTVNAAFTYSIAYGCETDTVIFNHNGSNGVNKWRWELDDNLTSTNQKPVAVYSAFGPKNIVLEVSNGSCSDTVVVALELNNDLTADFRFSAKECTSEPVEFISAAKGQITKHQWTFGDGTFSDQASPLHTYQQPTQNAAVFRVSYSVTNEHGCTKSITKPLDIYSNCAIYVPNAFTPNGDGKNDLFRPLNVKQEDQFEFRILNRWGQEMFFTKNRGQGWDGNYKGQPQATGTFIWMMRYTDRNTKKIAERKGSLLLIR